MKKKKYRLASKKGLQTSSLFLFHNGWPLSIACQPSDLSIAPWPTVDQNVRRDDCLDPALRQLHRSAQQSSRSLFLRLWLWLWCCCWCHIRRSRIVVLPLPPGLLVRLRLPLADEESHRSQTHNDSYNIKHDPHPGVYGVWSSLCEDFVLTVFQNSMCSLFFFFFFLEKYLH